MLAVRRELLPNRVPTVPGGGAVAYVRASEHRYLADPVDREEGGTPAIVGSIRAGLVFQLKEAVGAAALQEQERSFIRRAVASWGANPNIELLGDLDAERLCRSCVPGIHDSSSYLHHNFVVAGARQRPVRRPVPGRLLLASPYAATGCSASTSAVSGSSRRSTAGARASSPAGSG